MKTPTHPELLNWLASQFRDNGWSIKQLHRSIVLSATYRQSSHARPDLDTRDPMNSLLARQSRLRLPAENIRDAALAVSGLVHPAIGGRSVRPQQPKGVADLTYGTFGSWVEDTGRDRYRRGLYIHFQRSSPYPLLMNFDAPDANVACVARRRSNTPLQALNLLNDPVFVEAAQALAVRTLLEAPPARRLEHAFRLTLGRGPTASELRHLSSFLDELQSASAASSGAPSAFELDPRLTACSRTSPACWSTSTSLLPASNTRPRRIFFAHPASARRFRNISPVDCFRINCGWVPIPAANVFVMHHFETPVFHSPATRFLPVIQSLNRSHHARPFSVARLRPGRYRKHRSYLRSCHGS